VRLCSLEDEFDLCFAACCINFCVTYDSPIVLGMAHFSLGRGSGSFVGGFMIGEVGTRDAFRYMGLIAVAGGVAYKIIHMLWLKKFDSVSDDSEATESGESEKLSPEPKYKDASTSMSTERLSMISLKYNKVGSLSSIPRSLNRSRVSLK
jgi:hypothetical protein